MRILLAEDERSLARAIVKIFEKNHYSADAVHNGEDALAYLASGNYDVAVLDIMMPKMDGITVLRTLRAEGNPIPVLMLTAKAEIDDKVRGAGQRCQLLPDQALRHQGTAGRHPRHHPRIDCHRFQTGAGQHHPRPRHL